MRFTHVRLCKNKHILVAYRHLSQPPLASADTDISETCLELPESGRGHPEARDLDRFINSAKQLAGGRSGHPGERHKRDAHPEPAGLWDGSGTGPLSQGVPSDGEESDRDWQGTLRICARSPAPAVTFSSQL